MSGYEILSLDDLDRLRSTDGRMVMLPLRRRLGFQPFGLNAWEGTQAGDQVIERHRELQNGHEELYVVVRGAARFTLGDETFDAPTGTLVHAPPDTFREATALEAGTIVLVAGAKPGEAFTPRGWEEFYVAFALLAAGSPVEARASMAQALARDPDAWQGQYNAACFEALAGGTDAALAYLAVALAKDPTVAEHAAADEDLASLRDDPRYAELVK